jgi:hypothetical protein
MRIFCFEIHCRERIVRSRSHSPHVSITISKHMQPVFLSHLFAHWPSGENEPGDLHIGHAQAPLRAHAWTLSLQLHQWYEGGLYVTCCTILHGSMDVAFLAFFPPSIVHCFDDRRRISFRLCASLTNVSVKYWTFELETNSDSALQMSISITIAISRRRHTPYCTHAASLTTRIRIEKINWSNNMHDLSPCSKSVFSIRKFEM